MKETVCIPRKLLLTIQHAFNRIPNTRNAGKDGESTYNIASMIELAVTSNNGNDKTLKACKAALKAFRKMYDAMENGAEVDEILNDKSYWPLSILREALESE